MTMLDWDLLDLCSLWLPDRNYKAWLDINLLEHGFYGKYRYDP